MSFRRNFTNCIMLVLVSMFFSTAVAQNDFTILNAKRKFRQKFELANDLVIVPVMVNGRELSFLLDTGVNSTILFSLSEEDSSSLKNPKVVYLRGLGVGKPLRALKSANNKVQVGEALSSNHSIYIIEAGVLNISNRVGVAINGIIGYDFFKDVVVEFNYKRHLMQVYAKEEYRYAKCRRCIDIPLRFYREKPYIEAEIEMYNGNSISVDLLMDSGSGDALWLFEDSRLGLHVPERSFDDFLGFGITGSVYGKRGRISRLSLKRYDLEDVTTSFPDSLSLAAIDTFEERDGSLGAQVLKRFHLVVDYPGKNLRLKPNSDFNEAFEYNMSGVVVRHSGEYRIVQSEEAITRFQIEDDDPDTGNLYSTRRNIVYSLQPNYEVAEIRPDSPAARAGLLIGDEILKLNGRPVYQFDLQEIAQVLSSKEGRKIKIEVNRKGIPVKLEFRLKRIL